MQLYLPLISKNNLIEKKDAKELKYKLYFTGKKCLRGHITERRTCNGHCIICEKERKSSIYRFRCEGGVKNLLIKQNYRCAICNCEFIKKEKCSCHSCKSIKNWSKHFGYLSFCYEIDHIIPFFLIPEGSYDPKNFHLLCLDCNIKKYKKNLNEMTKIYNTLL